LLGQSVEEEGMKTAQQEGFTANSPKHPDIKVTLTGTDSNSFSILGKVQRALRRGGVPEVEIDRWREEATSGDADNLLATCMRWVDVD
jgi:hypothetical protein